ncbi:MAG: sulfite exporter TauE/SafE family protein [Candidatus Jordarchaeales archaeon]
MVVVVWLVLCVLGLVVGIIGGFLGVGGGFLNVPVLHFVGGLGVAESVGSSLVVILMTASSSAVGHLWQRRVDAVLSLALGGVTVPGSVVGSLLTGVAGERIVGWVFSLGLVAVGLAMASGVRVHVGLRLGPMMKRRASRLEYEVSLPLVVAGGFLAGLTSGFLGIGGGVVQVPLLVGLGVPVHVAVGTSCLTMIFTSLAGVVGHAALGQVDLFPALVMGVGGVLGGLIGSALSGRVSGVWLRRIFGVFLCLVGVYMLVVG